MSFFNRMLASVGIGNARLDTLLEKDSYEVGEVVRGVVRMNGGSVEQSIDNIYVSVYTQYLRESNDRKVVENCEIARFHVFEPFTLQPNEQHDVPFSFELPWTTPLTIGKTSVWIRTGLDIRSAVDPTDKDYIDVIQNDEMAVVLDAFDTLGFRLRKADCEYAPRRGNGVPFVQEFEFVPTTHFQGRLDEVEVIFYDYGSELELVLQIDRRGRGIGGLIAEMADRDESFVSYRIDKKWLMSAGVGELADELGELIAKYA